MNEDDENSSDAESEEDNAEDDILALTPVRARLRTAAVRNAKRRGGGEDKTYSKSGPALENQMYQNIITAPFCQKFPITFIYSTSAAS
jgi:hypothetical protein